MLRIITITTLILFATNVFSQFRVGFESNAQYYIDDHKIKLVEEEAMHRFRSNSYLKIEQRLKDFEFGLQAESYAPKALLHYNPNLERTHLGIIYTRYNNPNKGVDFTVGHFYEQFGSGLSLRFWEDRALGINNALFGGRFKWNFRNVFDVKLLGGKQRIGMGFDFSKGSVFGTDIEVDIAQLLQKEDYTFKVGSSVVVRSEDITYLVPDSDKNTAIFALRSDFNDEHISLSAEYLYKTKDVLFEQREFYPKVNRAGNAFLFNVGYNNNDNLALNITLRRLENFRFVSQRNIVENIYNYGMINYLPALTKQYEHSLQHIYTYQAQAALSYYGLTKMQGEMGGQFDLFYEAAPDTFLGGSTGASFALNGSYWAGLKNNITTTITYDRFGLEIENIEMNSPILEFGQKYYHDLALEYRKSFSDDISVVFSYLNQYYNSAIVQEPYRVKAHTLALEGIYFFTPTQSLRVEWQHQWASEDLKNWIGSTIEYTPNSHWAFFINDIYNYGNHNSTKRVHFYNTGLTFIHQSTRITASYGRQRGGILCVGGICRVVPEAAGITLGITTNF
ncbi:DUF6029 family protein [Capnocytophaga catalasegens]|uniref:DUF5723 domain-containing protein n=1 Tax=Capnocytophaga catalasegens TaxID=1004260 RepID=A0AAV5AV99_9FLAO|nr:DUF6029 family protein [Capnocytophaga catalasegens]GIZ14932.1 hypothetical protein RCZ03_09320 [Capnocytophaga catalasegens]GJM49311.1 hypothetical protein RCZ15_02860 [Capnocytophaga catalasegens]GJM52462.1 hypothetical protein RCZ16_07790 [Capnocytophaga catalasegens]